MHRFFQQACGVCLDGATAAAAWRASSACASGVMSTVIVMALLTPTLPRRASGVKDGLIAARYL